MEKEKEKEENFLLCESIGHRPLRGRCPKSGFDFKNSSLYLFTSIFGKNYANGKMTGCTSVVCTIVT